MIITRVAVFVFLLVPTICFAMENMEKDEREVVNFMGYLLKQKEQRNRQVVARWTKQPIIKNKNTDKTLKGMKPQRVRNKRQVKHKKTIFFEEGLDLDMQLAQALHREELKKVRPQRSPVQSVPYEVVDNLEEYIS